jgi:hypothetical protein
MRVRRLICLVLGLWLGAGLLMDWMAASSFRNVERIIARPGPAASAQIRTLGRDAARTLLRYQAAEQNRSRFATWERAQLSIGSLFFFYLLFGTSERKFALLAVLGMLAAVVVQRLGLTPELQALSPETGGAGQSAFRIVHRAYLGLEALKWGLGLALALKTVAGRRRSRSDGAGDEFDLVDKPDYRHVNG